MTKIGVACSHDTLLKSVNVTCHVVGECKQRQSPLGDRSVDTDTFAGCTVRALLCTLANVSVSTLLSPSASHPVQRPTSQSKLTQMY